MFSLAHHKDQEHNQINYEMNQQEQTDYRRFTFG